MRWGGALLVARVACYSGDPPAHTFKIPPSPISGRVGETFNLTNRTSSADVDVLNGATTGAAKNPRQMQLGLRVEL